MDQVRAVNPTEPPRTEFQPWLEGEQQPLNRPNIKIQLIRMVAPSGMEVPQSASPVDDGTNTHRSVSGVPCRRGSIH